jgi:hypothetical protein
MCLVRLTKIFQKNSVMKSFKSQFVHQITQGGFSPQKEPEKYEGKIRWVYEAGPTQKALAVLSNCLTQNSQFFVIFKESSPIQLLSKKHAGQCLCNFWLNSIGYLTNTRYELCLSRSCTSVTISKQIECVCCNYE